MGSFLFGILFGAIALWAYLEWREYTDASSDNDDEDDEPGGG